MPSLEELSLTADEIDDLLYLTRVNEIQELQGYLQELADKYSCPQRDIVLAGVDPETGNMLLHYCSANGFGELLRMLLKELGWSSSSEDGTATEGSKSAVLLINTANKEGNTPLHWAAYNGQLEVTKILVAAGADVWKKNNAGQLALYEAERANKNEVVHYLLDVGVKEAQKKPDKVPSATDVGFGEGQGESSNASGSAVAQEESNG